MKKSIAPALLLSIIFISCNKGDNAETPPPPDPPAKDPIRVERTIYTNEFNNELHTDTLTFTYDDQGRVTSRHSAKGAFTEQYIYTDGKLTSLKNISANGTAEVLNEAVYSANGDTIMLDFIQNGGGTDTVQLSYVFANNMQTDFWTYLHYTNTSGGCGCAQRHLQKEKWYYNSQGNISKTTIQTLLDSEEQTRMTVTAWDDKKNPKNGQAKLNALALALNVPLESFSLHNPTSYTDGYNTFEVEMTYNEEGYPLTYKFKNKDYTSVKLKYNRD